MPLGRGSVCGEKEKTVRKKGICRLLAAGITVLILGTLLPGQYRDLPFALGEEVVTAQEAPDATETPAVTEAPATPKPVVTEAPATAKPVVTEAPATEKPVVTEAPATEKPVVTEAPATEKPVVTEAPVTEKPAEPTPSPTAAQETEDPTSGADPTATITPSPTEQPGETGEPSATDSPKPTDDPDATPTPLPSEDPDATESPSPTPGPDATQTPAPSEEPEEEFVTDGDVLVRYTGTGKVVSVPRGIRIIGPDAFLGNESLEAVILPDSVEEIGERAFGNCPKLKEVILSTDSLLKKIGSRAFLNCVKISRAFAENIEQVAADAFEGVPEETPVPVPTVPVTPEPQPTEDPWEEPDDPEDPYEDIEWEPLPVPGGGGGGGGKWQPHAKSRQTMTHDYDQVQLDGAEQAEPMSILTLGDEQLQIGMAEGLFTVHLEEIRDEETEENHLVLTAVEETGCRWEINGAGLRKLEKSGIDRLVLQSGAHTVSMPTEGYLAGWKYEELKSRGTAGRRFTFFLEMNATSSKWSVDVQGDTTELGTDPLSDMYLTGVTDETAQDGDMGGST